MIEESHVSREWRSVPLEHLRAWRDAFQSSRKSNFRLPVPCPLCGQFQLHRYYQGYEPQERIIEGERYVARGGLWEWCKACRIFAHYQALVPEWWHSDLEIEMSALTPYPDAIEEAISKKEYGFEQEGKRSS